MTAAYEAKEEEGQETSLRMRAQLRRLEAQVVAEKEWHAVTKASVAAYQRAQTRLQKAATAPVLVSGPSTLKPPQRLPIVAGEVEVAHPASAAVASGDAESTAEVEGLRLRWAEEASEVERLQRLNGRLHSQLSAQLHDSAALISQLTQRIGELESQLHSPASQQPRNTQSRRAAAKREEEEKEEAKEKEEEEEGGWFSPVVSVHAAPFVRLNTAGRQAVVAATEKASESFQDKADRSLSSPLSPLLSRSLQWSDRDDLVRLRSEVRMQAVEMEEAMRQKAEAEERCAQLLRRNEEEQTQWMALLDRAVLVNRELKERLEAREGKSEDGGKEEKGIGGGGGAERKQRRRLRDCGDRGDAAPVHRTRRGRPAGAQLLPQRTQQRRGLSRRTPGRWQSGEAWQKRIREPSRRRRERRRRRRSQAGRERGERRGGRGRRAPSASPNPDLFTSASPLRRRLHRPSLPGRSVRLF